MEGFSRHLAMGAGAVVCIGGSVILWGIHSEMTAVVSGLTVALSGMYGWGTLSNAFPTKRIKGEWHTPIDVQPKEQPASHVQQAIDAIYGAYRPVVEAYEKEIKGPMQKDSQSEELNGQQAEAKMLDRYIRRTLRFPLAIHYKRVIKTPLHFLYRIDPVADAPYNIDLFNGQILQQIEQQCAMWRQKSSDDDIRETPVSADLLRSQPPFLRVTNPKPTPNVFKPVERKPFVTALGTVYEPKAQPVTLNLGGKDCTVSNGLFCGMSGMGKSRTIHAGLLGLLRSTPPELLHVYALETKTDAYRIYGGLPHMKAMVGELEGVLPVLEQFQHWCTTEGRPTDGAVRLLIFDEFQLALADDGIGEQVLKLVTDIMSRGREAGLRVWIATQTPDAKSYPSNLKSKTHFYVVCKIKIDTYVRQVFGVKGASSLRPKLEFIYSGDGDEQKVAAFDLPDEVLEEEIADLKKRYAPSANPLRTATATATATATGSATGSATQPLRAATGSTTGSSLVGGAVRSATAGRMVATPGRPLSQQRSATAFPLETIRPLSEDELNYVSVQIVEGNPALFYRGNVGLNKLTSYLYGKPTPQKYKAAKVVMEQLGLKGE